MSDKNKKTFFYFISKGQYTICDVDFCSPSERTFDISFFDLANNEKLVNKLKLIYIHGIFLNIVTYESRAKFFSGYLSAFSNDREKEKAKYEKLITNPMVRVLVEDEELFNQIGKIIVIPPYVAKKEDSEEYINFCEEKYRDKKYKEHFKRKYGNKT